MLTKMKILENIVCVIYQLIFGGGAGKLLRRRRNIAKNDLAKFGESFLSSKNFTKTATIQLDV